MIRFLIVLLTLLLFFGCGRPGSKRSDEERAVQEELQTQESTDEAKDPDGAFGAKDYAGEARDLSDRNSQAAESALEETDRD